MLRKSLQRLYYWLSLLLWIVFAIHFVIIVKIIVIIIIISLLLLTLLQISYFKTIRTFTKGLNYGILQVLHNYLKALFSYIRSEVFIVVQ